MPSHLNALALRGLSRVADAKLFSASTQSPRRKASRPRCMSSGPAAMARPRRPVRIVSGIRPVFAAHPMIHLYTTRRCKSPRTPPAKRFLEDFRLHLASLGLCETLSYPPTRVQNLDDILAGAYKKS